MKRVIDDLKYFFRKEFCTPLDFFWIDWKTVKKNMKTMPVKVIFALIILIPVSILLMAQYYTTLPFRLLNEIAQSWCE